MLWGPSLLIWPCGRCAALPQIGRVVSISRLSQWAVSSTAGLPCVRIAPSYLPLAITCCAMLVTRASAGRGGADAR